MKHTLQFLNYLQIIKTITVNDEPRVFINIAYAYSSQLCAWTLREAPTNTQRHDRIF